MIRNPHRVRGASALGATEAGQPGPFGVYAEDEPDDVDDGQDEPTTSAVELAVQQRIEAAERKAAARKRDRAAFAAARSYGLARRHAAKLRHLAERRAAATANPTDADGHPPDNAAVEPRPQRHPQTPAAARQLANPPKETP